MTGARRPVTLATVLAILLTSCTGDGSEPSAADDTTTTTVEETTTTTAAPLLYGLVPNLGLAPEQCWAAIPAAATTTTEATTTTTSSEAEATTTTLEETVPETLPPTVTTTPQAPMIGVVDCAGTHDGQAYASFCLSAEFDAFGDPTGELAGGPCGGDPEAVDWPGDRKVRRAAARVCLEHFTQVFGVSYEASPLVAREFTPTEGIWDRGERRVVCTTDTPEVVVEDNAESTTETTAAS